MQPARRHFTVPHQTCDLIPGYRVPDHCGDTCQHRGPVADRRHSGRGGRAPCRQELQVCSIEDRPDGRRRVRIRLCAQLAAIGPMARMRGWHRPQQVQTLTTDTRQLAALREVLHAMTAEERAAWLNSRVPAMGFP